MLQINNKTPFKGSLAIFANPEGVDCAYGIVKATFAVDDGGAISIQKNQLAINDADVFWGEPGQSSLKQAGEICLAKPSTDILLCGHAYAPDGETRTMDVRLSVGAVAKTVRVFGNRIWEGGFFGMRITPPETFTKIPLRYEYAFGGVDPQPDEENKIEDEPRNPVGRGLLSKYSKASWEGVPLPNLEDSLQLIASPKDRPSPACFAPVCPHWEPRKSYAGTYDDTWTKKRAPYLPRDFNPRFLQVATPGLIAPTYLQGGESVEITGATPGAPLRLKLPSKVVSVVFHFDEQVFTPPLNLDTVCFEPDEKRFTMIWRSCLIVDKKVHRLRELELLNHETNSAREVVRA